MTSSRAGLPPSYPFIILVGGRPGVNVSLIEVQELIFNVFGE
jgi:hypothetical protein